MATHKRTINIGGEEVELPSALNPKLIGWIAALLVVVIIMAGSIYQVSPEELGVVMRFGKYVRTTDPGLHAKLPLGIESLIKVPIQRQLKQEFGFRTVSAGIRTQYRKTGDAVREAIMLTGDLNVAMVEWIVQYKIRDPYKYLFKLRNAQSTFRYMNEAVVRQIVGDNSVDEVITIGRSRIAMEAKQNLQDLCDLYEIGIEVSQLIFQDVNPPDPVKPSFNEVNQSIQEKERKINEAWSEYNAAIPKAKGEAEQMISAAEGYAMARVNEAEGDVKKFEAIYKEYARAPRVTKKRLYLEAMKGILPALKNKIIMDDKGANVLPLLNLGKGAK
ncbi:FtsH protease activity modulator HflK [bacterium]|nr:FtsH protease activity modulator HflK [bacterium]